MKIMELEACELYVCAYSAQTQIEEAIREEPECMMP